MKTTVIGATLVVLGVVVLPLAAVLLFLQGESTETQFVVPGSAQVDLAEPGRYYLWNDYQTIFQGRTYRQSGTIPSGLQITITDADTGKELPFVSDTSISATSNNDQSNTIGYVEVASPCTVDVEVTGGDEQRVFSLAKTMLPAVLALIGGFAFAALLALAGVGIGVWGVVKLMQGQRHEQVANG